MKKSIFVLLILMLAVSLAFVACKHEPPAPPETEEDGFVHVSTWTEFAAALESAKLTEKKTVFVDADLTFDSSTYSKSNPFTADVTGLTIDLGAHTISGVNGDTNTAFDLTGSNFTLKNGTILSAEGNNRYSITINYNGTNASTTNGLKEQALEHTPAAYTDSNNVWKNRIIVDGINATGMLCGYSTVEIKNSSFTGGPYRGLVLQGSSGIVENVTASHTATSGSAGFVAHSYGTVLVKGACVFKGKFGVYSANCANLNFDSSAVVTAEGVDTYALYLETQGKITVNSGAQLTLKPVSGKAAFYMRSGAMVDIKSGAVLKDAEAAAIAKPIPAALIDASGDGAKDADWPGYGSASTITDNR